MLLPEVMTGAVLTGHGGLEKVVMRDDLPVPAPGPGEVLLKVDACGMNNTDINTRIGWYSRSIRSGTTPAGGVGGIDGVLETEATWGFGAVVFPRIQGADIAGRIIAVGDGVCSKRVGERVLVDPWLRDPSDPENRSLARYLGSERDGGFAQYASVPAENAFRIRSKLPDAELATFPCAYSTAEHMLTRIDLKAGESILIPGASGGVGSALVQLAGRRKARVIALTSPSKMDAVKKLGADHVLDRKQEGFAALVRQSIPFGELDAVADVVGGRCFPEYLALLCRGGRYVTSGAIAGPIVELDLRTLYLKDLQLHGATVVPLGIFKRLVGYIENEEIRPLLAKTFPLSHISKAQTEFLAKNHMGNFVLSPG